MSKVKIRDSVRRTEDVRFVSGQGTYIDDMNADRQLVGVFVQLCLSIFKTQLSQDRFRRLPDEISG